MLVILVARAVEVLTVAVVVVVVDVVVGFAIGIARRLGWNAK